jgi:ABC-type amino acid transport substrate-binding protein
VQQAIDAGTPMVTVGDPVFYESLSIAFDNQVPDNDSLVAAVDRIVGEMHADGTLQQFSQKWFRTDYTTAE